MDANGKLLLITFSPIPLMDKHSAMVTGAVRALNRLFESIDVVSLKGDYLSHIERFHTSRLLRVPLVGDDGMEQSESFRRAVRRQIDSEVYDVVHVRSPLEGLPVSEAKAEKGYRLVYEAGTFAVHDAIGYIGGEASLSALEAQIRREELICASRADLIIVHSETAKRALQAKGIGGSIEVIPNGVNIDVYDWEPALEAAVPILLCLGRMESWRDVTTVLESVRRTLAVTPIKLRWIGEPDDARREHLRAVAADLGISQAVSLEPPVEAAELPQIISSATICLVSVQPIERFTEWGDQPPGLMESLACQRPVIAARTAGIEEAVRDGTEALLYTPGDAASLTSSLLFLLRNTGHRRLLAKRGYRRVREQFCESSQRRQVVQAYRELLGLASGYTKIVGDFGKDSQPPPPPVVVQGDEPVTAVMRTAEEAHAAPIDSDTAQIRVHDEHIDAEPSVEVTELDDEPKEQSWSWQNGTEAPGVHHETRKHPAIPPTPEDTSRFPAVDLPSDLEPDPEA
jgi:glycosyltransferase involved in cell wall biosynthesis